MQIVRAVLVVLMLIGTGCGAKTKSGQCKDYKPLDMCDDNSNYECDITDDGCEICGCVPIRRN